MAVMTPIGFVAEVLLGKEAGGMIYCLPLLFTVVVPESQLIVGLTLRSQERPSMTS
jgi:hypothetical protein